MVIRRMLAVVALAGLAATSCFQVAGYGDFTFVEPVRTRIDPARIDKVDLLLVVDNSRGLADKQLALEGTLSVFLQTFLEPPCRDGDGVPIMEQPGPDEACPDGSARDIRPVRDVHVGIVTSSLGGHGGDACTGRINPSENTKAHLQAGMVATYQGLGFLAWDPLQQKSPPGEADLTVFTDGVLEMLAGLGEVGCGYEAQLESWYRFLVEPDPYETISIVNDAAVLEGTDTLLLDQRAAFLRPDSLVVIALLSDEDDCSIRDGGQFYFAAEIYQPGSNTPYHLPKPRAACAIDPNDPCCRSCGQGPGDGCDTSQDDCAGALDGAVDHINLRCFDQKYRFGIDFLWPIDRYVSGLTTETVTDRYGNLVGNPLLAGRDPSRVVLTAIVGVPWQDVARRDENGEPSLSAGLDAAGQAVGGFQNGAELTQNGVWDLVLGDPLHYHTDPEALPDDPLMIQSIAPRSGTNPITDDPLAPPGDPYGANPINGHEYTIDNDDLQYACVYPLLTARDCALRPGKACDCTNAMNDNPVCQDPDSDEFGTIQWRTKAYPGIRHLEVAKALGPQAVVASACVPQLSVTEAKDYGYKAAFEGAITDRVRTSLREQICLEQPLRVAEDGSTPCVLIEAIATLPGDCSCNGADGRRFVDSSHDDALQLAKTDPTAAAAGWNCFCELVPAAPGYDLDACRTYPLEPVVNQSGKKVDGWCYLDPTTDPPIGDPAIASVCPASRPHAIRIAGRAEPRPDATLFLFCE
jgi:hypothetical protein